MLRCVTLHCFPSFSHVLLEDRMEEERGEKKKTGWGEVAQQHPKQLIS